MGRERALVLILRSSGVAVLVALWSWAAHVGISFGFPAPGETLLAGWRDLASGDLVDATLTSMQSLGMGLGAAVVVGVPFGLLMGTVRAVGRVARVYLDLFIALPTAALIPLVILSFGISRESAAAVVFMFSAPFVAMNTYGGVREVPERLIEMSRVFNASRLQVLAWIVLPAATPMIFGGLRYGLSRAFVGLVVVELLLSPFGLGRLIVTRRAMFEYDHMFAAVLWTIGLAVLVLALLERIETRVLRWRTIR